MIDYFALALGHGLMAFAILRLVMRESLDADPLLGDLDEAARENRFATTMAGRNAARRASKDQAAETLQPEADRPTR